MNAPRSTLRGLLLVPLLLASCGESPEATPQLDLAEDSSGDVGDIQADGAVDTPPDGADGEDADSGSDLVDINEEPDVGCLVGSIDCACDAGACAEGQCIADICVDCELGELGCACDDEGHCATGGRCDENGTCEICPDEEEGCPCSDEGSCGEGLVCESDLCLADPCEAGLESCPCDTGGVCAGGLGCHVDDICYVCAADAPGCECLLESGCSNGLVCDAIELVCRIEVDCEDLTCLEFQLCDEGADGEDAGCTEECVEGYEWDASSGSCLEEPERTCVPDVDGSILANCTAEHRLCVTSEAGAECGECEEGYTEELGTCRVLVTCTEIGAACASEHKACVESDGATTDAVCGPCQPPYDSDGRDGCVLSAEANCSGDDPYSIRGLCLEQSRDCEDVDEGPASCADCISGYGEDTDGSCREFLTCAEAGCDALGRRCIEDGFADCEACLDGLAAMDPDDPLSQCLERLSCFDISCGEGEVCRESTSGGNASCVEVPCEDGQAYSELSSGCVTCGGNCSGIEGATGAFWPFTDDGGRCLCETEVGWYLDTSSSLLPEPCDQDGDGWIRIGAREYVEASDPEVAANARCDVRTIDRIALQNDLGQRLEVLLCEEGYVVSGSGSCTPREQAVSLYEPAVLDDDDDIAADSLNFPSVRYDGTGRKLRAVELNPLTRACANGDMNRNGVPDVQEIQGAPPGVTFVDAIGGPVFYDFSSFIELHRGFYEERPSETYGRWVVAERSRCNGEASAVPFPIGYDEASGSEYWRDCLRNRRASYDASTAAVGYDFARWSCDDVSSGTCPAGDIPPLSSAVPVDSVPVHGACEVPAPSDGIWRGMNHHSQFRCVQAVDAPSQPWQIAISQLYHRSLATGGTQQFNGCGVACPDDDPSCTVDCASGGCETTSASGPLGVNPAVPILSCDQVIPSSGAFGFVAQRYLDERAPGDYQAGCVDEWLHWPQLCPGFETERTGAIGDGQETDFGSLACGCGFQYGGLACDRGCPGAVHSDDYRVSPRSGWWVCGDVTSTSMETFADGVGPVFANIEDTASGVWRVDGQIRVAPRLRTPLSGTGSEGIWTAH